MFDFIKIPFKDSKVSISRPFLCDKVKQFGICEGTCAERHDLCKTLDKECLNIPTKCLINIQLTKILSASHFYGRILKYSTKKNPTKDQDWISVNDSFERIKYELKNIGSTPNTIILSKTFTIGEMVMVQTEQKEFYRAVVLDIDYGWLTVKVKVILIDMGHTEEISSNKIFVLPSHLKELRPVAVEIIISSMEPVVEGGSVFNWPVNTTNLVRSLLEPIILTDLEFICKVELTLGITLWVDWILAKKCIKCSHIACKLYKTSLILPNELIKRNLARRSSLLVDKLINLDKDAYLWKKHLNAEKPLIVKKSSIPLFSCDEQKNEIDEVIKVQWAHLSEHTISNVSVRYVDSPKCFFVINMQFYERVIALQRDIDDAISNKTVEQLTCATVGNVCLALAPEENKYNRVIIQKINGKKAEVLFVDYGEFYEVEIDNLLTIPSSLLTKLPLQVIECSLSGFNVILPTDDVAQFNNRLLELTDTKIHLKVLSSTTNAKFTGGTYYEVVLFSNDMNINSTMADEFNMYVDNTQIQNILSSNYKYKEYESEVDDDDDALDEEEFKCQMDLLESLFKTSNQTNETQTVQSSTNETQTVQSSTNETQTVPSLTNEKINVSESKSLNKDNIIANNEQIKCIKIEKKYCLDCNVTPVVPQCFWHQDDTWIYLKLNILSVNDYNTLYTMDTITINVETNSVSYSFTAVLFGFIIDELCTCRVGFDGIFIKAKKLIKVKYHWPRLLKCTKKHKYIIYNTEFCIDESKNLNLWCRVMNNYKIQALGEQLNVKYLDSDFDDTDYSDNSDGIFED
ncbi:putative ATP-dependent RNA helicase TDRD12 [Acyrthosiphon pisum]|uniref:RNA helicase n=1 Tax=Acyrthosiphon pisum TaxID=7029 RepID=A0A8R2D526_ACYPI|nr:putative ATP-dependent RNA helicase TDRD12 [Acyrthosiphon pisum]|eukprot:XP_016661859.1 PREDICTED: putative ATP-dependent RNA helicase TDRD12 [Acyrthosiphon pisum]